MQLIGHPDGAVDRKDRANWVTEDLDLAWAAPPPIDAVGLATSVATLQIGDRGGTLSLDGAAPGIEE